MIQWRHPRRLMFSCQVSYSLIESHGVSEFAISLPPFFSLNNTVSQTSHIKFKMYKKKVKITCNIWLELQSRRRKGLSRKMKGIYTNERYNYWHLKIKLSSICTFWTSSRATVWFSLSTIIFIRFLSAHTENDKPLYPNIIML